MPAYLGRLDANHFPTEQFHEDAPSVEDEDAPSGVHGIVTNSEGDVCRCRIDRGGMSGVSVASQFCRA